VASDHQRGFARYQGWVLASGLVGILLSVALWANLPVTAVWLIGLLLGIEFISIGPAFAFLAWRVRKELPVQQGSPSRR
jgi:uncharacterized membrane protein HdeD (DUF308 family)